MARRKPRTTQVVDETKPRSFTTPEHAEQLLDSVCWSMDTRYRVFKSNPSPTNLAKLQVASFVYQAVYNAKSAVYRAQLVALWSSCGRDVDRFFAQL